MIVPPGSIIGPGSTIGIVGGGQLGRMLALAAAQLGYRCHVYAPDRHGPAAEVAWGFTEGAFEDEAALARFARDVDVITYEFENIPTAPLAAIAAGTALYPPVEALEMAQDRLTEKRFVERHGGRPAPYAAVDELAGLEAALAEIGTPAILKTRRFGYDGKGQVRIDRAEDAEAAWAAVRGAPAILEGFIAFDAEFSVLLCRGQDGETVVWDAPRNRHADGILIRSGVPAGAPLGDAIVEGEALARRVADALGHVGMLTLEFFASAARPCSTKWRRASTIAATGRSRARRPRNSRTISARSAAFRSATRPSPRRASKCATSSAMRRTNGAQSSPSPARTSTSTARPRRARAARWATSPGCSTPEPARLYRPGAKAHGRLSATPPAKAAPARRGAGPRFTHGGMPPWHNSPTSTEPRPARRPRRRSLQSGNRMTKVRRGDP